MGTTPRVANTSPLVLGGVVLGGVTGAVMAGLMVSPDAAPFPDFKVFGVALMGATVGAAVGLFLGGIGGLVMRLLEAQTTVVVVAAVGVVVGSVVLTVLLPLGLAQGSPREGVLTAGVLGLCAAGLAWWSRHRSVHESQDAV